MAFTDPAGRRSAGARRAGCSIAIAVSAALLLMLNAWPGWQQIPFLSSATGQVLWLVSLSLAAGIAASVVPVACGPPWVKSAGDLATTGIGLAAAIRIRAGHRHRTSPKEPPARRQQAVGRDGGRLPARAPRTGTHPPALAGRLGGGWRSLTRTSGVPRPSGG